MERAEVLSGFLYDHPGKHVQAKPRIHAKNFQSFWSAGAGWGVFSNAVRENRLHFSLSVKAGSLICRTVTLHTLGTAGETSVIAGKKKIAHQAKRNDKEIVITFNEDVRLEEGDRLTIII